MPAIELVANRGSVQNNTSGTSTACDMPAASSITVGNYLVARVAGDNSGTSGVARTLTVSDPRGNTWTVKGPANRTAGVASDGSTTWIAYCKVASAYTDGDDITFNYTGAIVAKAANIEEWRGFHPSSPEAVGSTTATGSSTTPSISRTPTGVGQLFYGALGIEGIAADTYTQDTDAVDGAWGGLTSVTGGDGVTAATSMTIRGASKVTGLAAQTWNPVITSRDWSQLALVFDRQWPAGIRGAHVDAATSSVSSWDVTVPEDTVTGDRGVAFVGYNPTTQDCPTPTGWTLVTTVNISASARMRFYKKTMTTAEAGTALTFTNTTAQRLGSGVIVFDGALYGDVDVSATASDTTASTTRTSPTSPTLTAAGIELNIWVERSSTPSVSITAPSGSTLEAFGFGQGSGSISGALAVDMTPVAAGGTVGGGNWVSSGSSGGWALATLAIFKLGQTVSAAQAPETDTASALTRAKGIAAGRAAEADTAATASRAKTRAVVGSAETDTAGVMTRSKRRTSGAATETDTAGTVVRSGHTIALGRATETDAGAIISHSKALPAARAVETSVGTGMTPRKLKAAQGATEADTAGAVTRRKLRTTGQAASTETATTVTRRKLRAIGQATETDVAGAVVRPGQVSRATETDTATALVKRKMRTIAQAADSSTATAVVKRKLRSIGQAISTETAAAFTKAKVKVLGATAETDTARPLVKLKARAVGRAVENGVARGVATLGVTIVVDRVVETSTATSITVRRIIPRPTGAVIPYPGGETIPRPSGTLIPRP